MVRDVRADFAKLEEFVRQYRLTEPGDVPSFRDLLSRQHKLYHALLTLLSEVEHQNWHPLAYADPRATHVNSVFRERLLEFASDLGSALFVWLHGAYKGARLLLRSGIENFIKAIGVIDHDQIVTVRNTYEVFDLAEAGSFFSVPLNIAQFKHLQDSYSILSRDVHTATSTEMQHVAALNFFPSFSDADARSFARLFIRSASASLEALAILCANAYRGMHHRNRDVVNGAISSAIRATLNQSERA